MLTVHRCVCLSVCRREQKDAKKEKKLKFKKNFATIQETVVLWEALRPKQTTKEQKQQLVSQIVNKVRPPNAPPLSFTQPNSPLTARPVAFIHSRPALTRTPVVSYSPRTRQVVGNVMGLANHHSASRVIQWCLKEGSEADKARLTGEIRANIVPLAKSKYGRFVVQKLINVAPKDEVPGVCIRGLCFGACLCCWSRCLSQSQQQADGPLAGAHLRFLVGPLDGL